jgi:hypothetical protein
MERIDPNRRKKVKLAINFIEELSWLLDNKKNIDLKELPFILREIIDGNQNIPTNNKYESQNQNKNYLIGILPNLFQDFDLFKTNLDLSDFAENVLHIPVNRAEKRSRYELIGLIVCEVINLDDSSLSNLVDALGKITGNHDNLKKFKEQKKKANFSWNEAIQQLSLM